MNFLLSSFRLPDVYSGIDYPLTRLPKSEMRSINAILQIWNFHYNLRLSGISVPLFNQNKSSFHTNYGSQLISAFINCCFVRNKRLSQPSRIPKVIRSINYVRSHPRLSEWSLDRLLAQRLKSLASSFEALSLVGLNIKLVFLCCDVESFFAGHVSLGCFFNKKCSPFSHLLERKDGLTTDECVRHCKDNRYPYAGFDHCSKCFCGTHFMTYAQTKSTSCKRKPRSRCKTLKSGCEASSHIEVFRTSKKDLKIR